MNAIDFSRGSCAELPPQALERYFNAHRQSFQAKIGRAICARCPILESCLTGTLQNPHTDGLQAGYYPSEIKALQPLVMPEGVLSRDALMKHMPTAKPLHVRNRSAHRVELGKRYPPRRTESIELREAM